MYQQLHDPAFLAVASGGTPALDLFFSATKALDSRITFSRGSSGTFINSSGLVETAASGVARFTHDPVTLRSLGLLIEESRTNLLTFSVAFDNAYWNKPAAGSAQAVVTANNATAPDGTVTASRVAFPLVSGSNYSLIYPGNPSTGLTLATAAHAASVWMRGVSGGESVWLSHTRDGVNYTQTAVVLSTSWQRVQLLFTPSGTTNNFIQIGVDGRAGNSAAAQQIFVWGAQLEAGAFATSYIPTTSATATRASDVATMTGTNFSSWFNSLGGTLVADGILGATSGSRRTFTFGGINLGVGTRVNGSASSILWRTPTNYDALTGTVSAGSIKQAFSYEPNLLSGVVNGGTIATNTPPSSLPALAAYIGASETGFDYWNGTIARIRYYRRRLPNANLQTLTT